MNEIKVHEEQPKLSFRSERAKVIALQIVKHKSLTGKKEESETEIILKANSFDSEIPVERLLPKEKIPRVFEIHRAKTDFDITVANICHIYRHYSEFHPKNKPTQAPQIESASVAEQEASETFFHRWRMINGKRYSEQEMKELGLDQEPNELEKSIFVKMCLECAEANPAQREKYLKLSKTKYPPVMGW